MMRLNRHVRSIRKSLPRARRDLMPVMPSLATLFELSLPWCVFRHRHDAQAERPCRRLDDFLRQASVVYV
jgi:hypothetical protein